MARKKVVIDNLIQKYKTNPPNLNHQLPRKHEKMSEKQSIQSRVRQTKRSKEEKRKYPYVEETIEDLFG